MTVFIPGTQGVVLLDNSGGSLVDISDDVSTMQLDVAYQSGSFHTFGLTGAQVTEGPRTFTGSLGVRPGETDDATNAHYSISNWLVPGSGVLAGARSLRIQHPDTAVGSWQYDMEIRATGYAVVSSDAGGDGTPTVQSLAFNVDGDVTLFIIV